MDESKTLLPCFLPMSTNEIRILTSIFSLGIHLGSLRFGNLEILSCSRNLWPACEVGLKILSFGETSILFIPFTGRKEWVGNYSRGKGGDLKSNRGLVLRLLFPFWVDLLSRSCLAWWCIVIHPSTDLSDYNGTYSTPSIFCMSPTSTWRDFLLRLYIKVCFIGLSPLSTASSGSLSAQRRKGIILYLPGISTLTLCMNRIKLNMDIRKGAEEWERASFSESESF